jgi:toxin ParE1/3/4
MKEYSVIWMDSAKIDLFSIIEYISFENKSTAQSIYKKIKKKVVSLSILPLKSRIIPELHQFNIDLYREIIESPWRIMYRIHDNTVIVLAIIDGRRDVEDIIFEKIMSLN